MIADSNTGAKSIRSQSAFLLATFLSSLGSIMFLVTFVSALGELRIDVFLVSLLIGVPRLAGFLGLLGFGSYLDRISARKLIFITELIGSLCSVFLFYLWPSLKTEFGLFLVVLVIRNLAVSIQAGSRSKLLRLASGDSLQSNSKTAIYLNQMTHGAFLLASLLSVFAKDYLSVRNVIVLDGVSFLVGGLVTFLSTRTYSETRADGVIEVSILNLYRYNGLVAFADLLLAIAFSGLGIFAMKLAGSDGEVIRWLYVTYGLGVWIGGILESRNRIKLVHWPFLLLLSGIFATIQFVPIGTWAIVALSVPLYMVYWILFHRYSAFIQAHTPVDRIPSTVAARNVQMTLVLVIGELVSGRVENEYFSLEVYFRSAICLAAFFLLLREEKRLVITNG